MGKGVSVADFSLSPRLCKIGLLCQMQSLGASPDIWELFPFLSQPLASPQLPLVYPSFPELRLSLHSV